MSIGWKIWFALLILAALYGLVMINDAQTAAELNDVQSTGAPQQTVVALWQLNDMAAIVVYELIVAAVAIASIGLYLASRGDTVPQDFEEPPRRGAPHVEGTRPDDPG